jgi:HEAT repeat protein
VAAQDPQPVATREIPSLVEDSEADARIAEHMHALETGDNSAPFTFMFAMDELSKMGPRVVPHLTGALKSRDRDFRLRAAGVLLLIGPAAHGAVPALTAALTDPDWEVRQRAANALGTIGEAASPALQTISARLAVESDAEVKEALARAAQMIGAKEKQAGERM